MPIRVAYRGHPQTETLAAISSLSLTTPLRGGLTSVGSHRPSEAGKCTLDAFKKLLGACGSPGLLRAQGQLGPSRMPHTSHRGVSSGVSLTAAHLGHVQTTATANSESSNPIALTLPLLGFLMRRLYNVKREFRVKQKNVMGERLQPGSVH